MGITMHELVAGECFRLISFGLTEVSYRRRLLALGLTIGTEVHVKRVAPLGCPIELDVRGTSLALRFLESSHLRWERV